VKGGGGSPEKEKGRDGLPMASAKGFGFGKTIRLVPFICKDLGFEGMSPHSVEKKKKHKTERGRVTDLGHLAKGGGETSGNRRLKETALCPNERSTGQSWYQNQVRVRKPTDWGIQHRKGFSMKKGT